MGNPDQRWAERGWPQLNHGNVVQTYEVGPGGERHFIVMEYLEGQSLAALLKRAERNGQPLPLGLHLRLLVLRGYDNKPLQLVHRDVST